MSIFYIYIVNIIIGAISSKSIQYGGARISQY